MWLHNCGPSSPLTMSFSVEICWNSHEKWLILALNFKAPCVPRQRRSKPNVKQHLVKCSHNRQAGILCMPYSHWQSIVNVLIYFCHCSVLVGKIYFFPASDGQNTLWCIIHYVWASPLPQYSLKTEWQWSHYAFLNKTPHQSGKLWKTWKMWTMRRYCYF